MYSIPQPATSPSRPSSCSWRRWRCCRRLGGNSRARSSYVTCERWVSLGGSASRTPPYVLTKLRRGRRGTRPTYEASAQQARNPSYSEVRRSLGRSGRRTLRTRVLGWICVEVEACDILRGGVLGQLLPLGLSHRQWTQRKVPTSAEGFKQPLTPGADA